MTARSLRFVVPVALGLSTLIACSGDGTGPEDADIEAVVVTGIPTGVLLVGDSVRLTATAVNATGGAVSNQLVSWKSSAPTVAAVRSNGVVLALGSGQAVITASVGGHDALVDVSVADGGFIGTQGGTVLAAGGVVTLTIPAFGVATPTLVRVEPVPGVPADSRIVDGTVFRIAPEDLVFTNYATLAIKYLATNLPSSIAGESLQLYRQSDAGWIVVDPSAVNLTTRVVTGSIYQPGVYAVRSTPVDRLELRGAAIAGALYSGQSAELSVVLYSAAGATLPPRTIQWQTSDPGTLTIDGLGKVTAVAAGTASITASTDGKSATAPVTVLAPVAADWSRATDWVTFQGNAQRTGFIDATLDPTVFRERWVATPIAGARYNPPTAVGGKLYVSTDGYFSAQALLALGAADGSVLWRRDFGGIFGINQPAYDDGTVYLTSGGHEDTFMWALRGTDGSLRFQTPFNSQWERWTAPIVTGSTVVTAGGYYGGMYGFDVATGQQRFFLDGPQVDGWGPAGSNGLVYRTGGGAKVVRATDGAVVGEVNDARLTAVTTPVLGNANDLLTIVGGRLMSIDLGSRTVRWDENGAFAGIPVTGQGVVYGFSGSGVAARRESDGALLWTWKAPENRTPIGTMVLTGNLLLVSTAGAYPDPGAVYGIDLATHLTVWSYPFQGAMALGSEGVLYIVSGERIAAIAVR